MCACAGALLALLELWSPPRADAAVPDYVAAVPVLAYHGIHAVADRARDPYSISPPEFARQMAMLDANGFNTISIAQFARFAAGDTAALPHRPILITFDDGRLDSYLAADPILGRFGMRATIFVITAKAETSARGYLGWRQLAAMAAGGRWDVQEHAHAGHVLIPAGPRGASGPYYANLLYRDGTRETFTAFKRRVTSDVLAGRRLLTANVPGFRPLSFAVPYGNYGQVRTNYAPIPGWERDWLLRTFGVVFVQDRRGYNLPGARLAQRYAIHTTTTAAALEAWLVRALPPGALMKPAPAPPRTRSRAPARPKLRSLRIGRRTVTMVLRTSARTRLKVDRRRRGRAHVRRIKVRGRGRVRDRHLEPHTRYVYRAVAVDRRGRQSPPLHVRLRTKR